MSLLSLGEIKNLGKTGILSDFMINKISRRRLISIIKNQKFNPTYVKDEIIAKI